MICDGVIRKKRLRIYTSIDVYEVTTIFNDGITSRTYTSKNTSQQSNVTLYTSLDELRVVPLSQGTSRESSHSPHWLILSLLLCHMRPVFLGFDNGSN